MRSIPEIISEIRKLQVRVTALEESKPDENLGVLLQKPVEKKMTQSERMKAYWQKRKGNG